MLEIDFAHFKFGLSAEDERLNSPHFDQKVKKDKLFASFQSTRECEHQEQFKLPEKLILLANEAFPESAINDPLGDLHVWDLWQSGIRSFPYPGQYLPLEIFNQDAKIQSSSTVGVVGECLAGVFATAGIAPWPIVRVIRNWPDFIFYDRSNSRFALVESKASTDIDGTTASINSRFDLPTFKGFLVDALRHLISDRSVSVWGAFTRVVRVKPFRAQLTFVETFLASADTNPRPSTMLNVLGEFVMQLALGQVMDELSVYALTDKKRSQHTEKKEPPLFVIDAIEDALLHLPYSMVSKLSSNDRIAIMQAAKESYGLHEKKILNSLESSEFTDNSHMTASTADFREIRTVGDTQILGRRLNSKEAEEVDRGWRHDWGAVSNSHYGELTDVYRCGGLLLATKRV